MPMSEPSAPQNVETSGIAGPVVARILSQYVRDLSFQNKVVQDAAQADPQQVVSVQVNLEVHPRGAGDLYEVVTKLAVTNKSKSSGDALFLLDLEYAGLFQIGGLTEQQLRPYLLTECPRITFPFVRRIVSDVTRDAGFPPLTIETIDFASLYRKGLKDTATV
jgi:preprotein translocase subunit SecB